MKKDISAPVLVIDLTLSKDEAKKPAELVNITGHQKLTLYARRAITLLWHNAHAQGIEEGKDYVIPVSELIPSKHKGREELIQAIEGLMTTLVTVRRADGSETRTQLLGGNDLNSPNRPRGTLTYTFDKRLIEVLKDSTIWGKISLPVLAALSSKYAISLYENVAQMAGLDYKSHQVMTLEEFRAVLGVEKDKYPTFGAMNQRVIKPAVKEINALASFGIGIVPLKTVRKVTHVRVSWWAKDEALIKEAWAELAQPRVGRKARIEDKAETVTEPYQRDVFIEK